MIQLNNEREIQAWVQFAAAAISTGIRFVDAQTKKDISSPTISAPIIADGMIEELRQRIVQEKDRDGWEYAPVGAEYRIRKGKSTEYLIRDDFHNNPHRAWAEKAGWQKRPEGL